MSREQLRVWAQNEEPGLIVTVLGKNAIEVTLPSGKKEKIVHGKTARIPVGSTLSFRSYGERFRVAAEDKDDKTTKTNTQTTNAKPVKRDWGATQIFDVDDEETKSSRKAKAITSPVKPQKVKDTASTPPKKTNSDMPEMKNLPSWLDDPDDDVAQNQGKKRKLPSWAAWNPVAPAKKQKVMNTSASAKKAAAPKVSSHSSQNLTQQQRPYQKRQLLLLRLSMKARTTGQRAR